jgi:hypothetical protein
MKGIVQKVSEIREALTRERPNDAADGTLDWLTFLVSLAPVPGVAEASAVANKIMSDRALTSRFESIVAEISKLNDRIQHMENGIQRVELIGTTAKDNAGIQSLLATFFDELKSKSTEFFVETSDWSTQEIIRTLINADWVNISATNQSRNLIEETQVRSQKTSLVAKGGSQNVVRDSSFMGDKGSVSMSGQHTQQGNVSFSGPSVTYQGQSSQTEMGGWYMGTNAKGNFVIGIRPEPEIAATCPDCQGTSKFRKSQLEGLTRLTCPLCGKANSVR